MGIGKWSLRHGKGWQHRNQMRPWAGNCQRRKAGEVNKKLKRKANANEREENEPTAIYMSAGPKRLSRVSPVKYLRLPIRKTDADSGAREKANSLKIVNANKIKRNSK